MDLPSNESMFTHFKSCKGNHLLIINHILNLEIYLQLLQPIIQLINIKFSSKCRDGHLGIYFEWHWRCGWRTTFLNSLLSIMFINWALLFFTAMNLLKKSSFDILDLDYSSSSFSIKLCLFLITHFRSKGNNLDLWDLSPCIHKTQTNNSMTSSILSWIQ